MLIKRLNSLAKKLMAKYGKGFSQRNLEQMRKFYFVYQKQIPQNNSAELKKENTASEMNFKFTLGWSHYLVLCRIKEEAERKYQYN